MPGKVVSCKVWYNDAMGLIVKEQKEGETKASQTQRSLPSSRAWSMMVVTGAILEVRKGPKLSKGLSETLTLSANLGASHEGAERAGKCDC